MRERGGDPQPPAGNSLVRELLLGIVQIGQDAPRGLQVGPSLRRERKRARGAQQQSDAHLYRVVDALEAVALETGKTVPQIAINWLLRRPTVSSVIIGARDEAQLRQNLSAVGWSLTPEQVAALDAASDMLPPYPHTPYRQQEGFARLAPAMV